MIDVVYNHTAHDSVLVQEHPEFFHQDESGKPVTTVPEWTDVIDLKHPDPEPDRLPGRDAARVGALWRGRLPLRRGLRSCRSISGWRARQAVEQVKPGVIWLAESVHAAFVSDRRARGLIGLVRWRDLRRLRPDLRLRHLAALAVGGAGQAARTALPGDAALPGLHLPGELCQDALCGEPRPAAHHAPDPLSASGHWPGPLSRPSTEAPS